MASGGASGLALEAGVQGQNLTEWQYGLASLSPRWNVSGTYLQVLPRFVSTKQDGSDEREFLFDYFADTGDLLDKVFLKGYQWPFDVRRVAGGSSIIDILVYLQQAAGRRVFLDFRQNPGGKDVPFDKLCREAGAYLAKAKACFGTPIERLLHMNQLAAAFYRDKGVDLAAAPLEIALCAQHNNGGLAVDCWWQTHIKGFFAVGEAAGTHGVYRPGGSALNAGQVGSTRAAQYITAHGKEEAPPPLPQGVLSQIAERLALAQVITQGEGNTAAAHQKRAAKRMSLVGGVFRRREALQKAAAEAEAALDGFSAKVRVPVPVQELGVAFHLYDTLICQQVYLQAMINYIEAGGKSRGSALYFDPQGTRPYDWLPGDFTFALDEGERAHLVQQAAYTKGACRFTWRPVRPIPQEEAFFETIWRRFREDGNIY